MEHNKDLLLPLRGAPKRYPFAVVDIESKSRKETTLMHIEKEKAKPSPNLKRIAELEALVEGDISQEGGFERPFLAGMYDGLKFTSFRGVSCLKTMLFYLLSPKFDGMTYYAHNGGAFDWLHFLPALEACGYSFEIMAVQSKIQCLRVKPHKDSKKKGWTFLDSYQLIPASLAKITKSFNTATVKNDKFDYDTHEDDPLWDEYLEEDCVSLYQSLMAFYEMVEDKLGGEVGMTTAATAMKTFRRSYQSIPIERHSEHHEFFRDAYYGGRVEIFREEVKGLHYYDINSAYPFAMKKDMPIGKLIEWEGEPASWLLNRIGFAKANVEVPEDTYLPILPYRCDKGRLIFPVGKFSGTWTAIELFAAIEQGAKVEWLESKWIDAGPIFSDYVDKLYSFRDKSRKGYDESLAYVAKIMLNSLYGKFATNTLREKIIFVSPEDDPPEGAMPSNPEDPECPIFMIEEEIDAPYIAPQIAAHITALARLQLHGFMTEGHEKGVLAYCDTDSIQTTANLDHLCGDSLGMLKDEGEGVIYHGTFLQPKLYSLEGVGPEVFDDDTPIPKWAKGWKACNGKPEVHFYVAGTEERVFANEGEIPKSEKPLIVIINGGSIQYTDDKIVMKGYRTRTKESFNTIRMGGSLTFETLEKIGSMVRKGFKDGPQVREITRMIRGEDTKRRHIGGITYPLVINEEIGDINDEDE